MNNMTTYGDKYRPAMAITTQSEADEYFEKLVQHLMSCGWDRIGAEGVERENLAYYAGYYSDETRERVERLFHGRHPVFGSIAENGSLTPEAAFTAGYQHARYFPSPK